MQKCDIEERTKSEREISGAKRPRGRSSGPVPAGYLSEADLAARWSRSTNTLVGWRTRLAEGRTRIPVELIGGVWCYHYDAIVRAELDPTCAWIRPADQRGRQLPPLALATFEQAYEDRRAEVVHPLAREDRQWPAFRGGEPLQPELPLSLPAGRVEVVPAPRGFASLRIEAGYALAIATDGAAFFAPVLGGLEFITWTPVNDLPTDDELLARFTRRAA